MGQACGPIGSVAYDCSCKNQWANNQTLSACVCDGNYEDWGIDPTSISTVGSISTNDCLMLPNLKVSGSIDLAWGDNGFNQDVGFVINGDTELNNTEQPQQIRVRSAIYNVGHGPIHIIGTEIIGSNPPAYNAIQGIYAKNSDGMKKYYFKETELIAALHPSHDHIHVDNFLRVTLRQSDGTSNVENWPVVRESDKISYCMVPTNTCNFINSAGTVLNNYCDGVDMANFDNYNLGNEASNCDWDDTGDAVMTLNPGKVDVYLHGYDGQGINYAGVCPGTYHLILEVDPDNHFIESNENDNLADMGEIAITADLQPAEVVVAPTSGMGTSWWSSSISTEDVAVNSIVRVPSNKLLYIKDKVVRLGQNAKIVVERGAKLIIENSLITSIDPTPCTDGTWQGIEVWGNPTIDQSVIRSYSPFPPYQANYNTSGDQPGIVIIKGSTIENAKTAILTAKRNADGAIDRNYVGGVVLVDEYVGSPPLPTPIRSIFRNNNIDINMDYNRSNGTVIPPIPTYSDYLTGSVISYVRKTDFIRYNFKNFGLNFNYVKNIDVSDCTFSLSITMVGTGGKGANLIHSHVIMQNNTFRGLSWGVHKFNAIGNYKARSKFINNQFEGVARGIYAYGSAGDLFENNRFLFIPKPNTMNIKHDTYGIYAISNQLFVARGNTFEGMEGANTSSYNSFGLVTEGGNLSAVGSGSYGGYIIADNHFSKTDYGLSMQGNNQLLQIDCNLFGHDHNPHPISAWAIPDGVVQEQGQYLCSIATAPADNEWQYNPADCEAIQDMQIGAEVTPFIYNAHAPITDINTIPNLDNCVAEDNITIQMCFEPKTNESCLLDDLMMPEGSPEKRLSDIATLDTRLANLEQNLAENEAQDELLAWLEDGGSPEGIAALIDNPLIPDAVLVSALNSLNQLSKENQVRVVQRSNPLSSQKLRNLLLHRCPLPDEVLKAMTERVVPVATEVLQDIKEAQSSLPDMPNREVLRRQHAQLSAEQQKARSLKIMLLLSLDNDAAAIAFMQNSPADDIAVHFALAQYHLAQGNIAQTRNTLQAMDSDNDYVNLLHIATDLAENGNMPTAQQVNDLQTLANSPIAQAAMSARTLLCAAADSLYEHPIRKLTTSSGKANYVPMEQENGNYVSFSPNPSDDFMTLRSNLTANATLIIYDQTGKMIQSIILIAGQQVAEINTNTWANGLYFYRLNSPNSTLQSGKFTVLHH